MRFGQYEIVLNVPSVRAQGGNSSRIYEEFLLAQSCVFKLDLYNNFGNYKSLNAGAGNEYSRLHCGSRQCVYIAEAPGAY